MRLPGLLFLMMLAAAAGCRAKGSSSRLADDGTVLESVDAFPTVDQGTIDGLPGREALGCVCLGGEGSWTPHAFYLSGGKGYKLALAPFPKIEACVKAKADHAAECGP